MRKFFEYAVLFAVLLLTSVSCAKGDKEFARENDKIVCDCTEQTIVQTIICDGEWYADCSDVSWLSVSPESGSSDGKYYSSYSLNVEYNSGAARTGIFYLISGGKKLPVEVTQGECEFEYGNVTIEGYFLAGNKVDAKIRIPYTCASGKESVSISFKMTGSSAGVILDDMMFDEFSRGEGEIIIPVKGVPEEQGDLSIEVIIDGNSVGTVTVEVLADPGKEVAGLPVGWNFYAAGINTPRGSEYDYSWSSDAKNPTSEILPYDKHRVLPTYGNEKAYLTAVSNNMTSVANYTFNPSIQLNGMLKDDYFLFVIPVKNFNKDTRISVEASFGAAGSAAGFFALEYSSDNKSWHMADGAAKMDVFGESGLVHYFVPAENTSEERKTYNKETDKGYRKYTFTLSSLEKIAVGDFYLRLRVCLDRRAKGSETSNTIAKGKWVDLKGLEVSLVEE